MTVITFLSVFNSLSFLKNNKTRTSEHLAHISVLIFLNMYTIFYTRWNCKGLLSKCAVCLRASCTLQVRDAVQCAQGAATHRCNTPLRNPLRCTLLSIIHRQGNAVRSLQRLGSATIRSKKQRRHCLYVGGKSL